MPNTVLTPQKLISRGKWNDYRDEIWGDSYNWSWVRPWSQLKYVVIHHTVTKDTATPDDIALLHKARGWAGIGYHFVIDKAGIVYYVGDISTARANVLNKNEQVIGITMVGDFTKHLPSDQQIESAHDLVEYLLFSTPSIPTLNNWNQLVGHKDLQATACPGTSWPDDMRQRIIDRRVYTPQPQPTPEPTPTPEPQPEPTPAPVVISDENAIIRLGKIGEVEYADASLKSVRNTIADKDNQIKVLDEKVRELEAKPEVDKATALDKLNKFSVEMKALLEV